MYCLSRLRIHSGLSASQPRRFLRQSTLQVSQAVNLAGFSGSQTPHVLHSRFVRVGQQHCAHGATPDRVGAVFLLRCRWQFASHVGQLACLRQSLPCDQQEIRHDELRMRKGQCDVAC